jgi:hypothetical protein
MTHTHTLAEWLTVLATCTAAAAVLFAPILALDHELPEGRAVAAAYKRAGLQALNAVDRLRIAVLDWLILLATVHPMPAAPEKGALR